MRVKLSRPLDFLVVADHSDNMGFFPKLVRRRSRLPRGSDRQALVRDDPGGRRRRGQGRARSDRRVLEGHIPSGARPRCPAPRPIARPGRRLFAPPKSSTSPAASPPSSATSGPRTPAATTSIASSSSATAPTSATQVEPYTTITPVGSDDPKDLWKVLAGLRGEDRRPGARHRAQRQPLERDHVPRDRLVHRASRSRRSTSKRARAGSRSTRSTQIKGDGEAHPFLSPDDEFADYETWDKFNLNLSVPKEKDMLQYEYARTRSRSACSSKRSSASTPTSSA